MTIERIQGLGLWPDAIRRGDFVVLSGRSAEDRHGDAAPSREGSRFTRSIEEETGEQIWTVFRHVASTLERAGSSLEQILLMNGWYADFRDWPIMDPLRRKFFEGAALPISTGFGAAGFAQPGTRAIYDALAAAGDTQREVVGSPLQVGSYLTGSKFGELIFLAGEVPADLERGIVITKPADLGANAPEVLTGVFGLDGWEGRMRAQTWSVYNRIAETLASAGAGLEGIVKQNVYLRNLRDLPAFERMSREILGATRPATTFVKVEEYGHQSFDLEVEVTAVEPSTAVSWLVEEEGAENEYPLAAVAGSLAFLSGIVGVEARSDNDVPVAVQAERIYDEAERILGRLGLDRSTLLRQVVYVADPHQIPAVEAVALKRTRDAPPATTFVAVGTIVPQGAAVQIDFTAGA